jgi:hypothetical protein
MKMMHALATADALSDDALLTHLDQLAGRERETVAELIAHLAALDERPSLYAAKGYSSLFAYCREALHLSEDVTFNRIAVARVCRKFPEILDRLASGELNVTNARLVAEHLTPANCEDILARAAGKRRREIDVLVAELNPRPDAPTIICRLPKGEASPAPDTVAMTVAPTVAMTSPPARPVIQATAPARFKVQFTVGQETHDTLRRLQDLLRREIPSGDPATIVDRALTLLLEKVEKAKNGAATKPREARSTCFETGDPRIKASRHVPRAVVRTLYRRDGHRCAFVSKDGHRCSERGFLEKHHVIPYAEGGPATADNMSLRCRMHNQYEAERIFGPRTPPDHGPWP